MALIYDTTFPPEPARAIKPAERPLPKGIKPGYPTMLECKHCSGAGHTLTKGFRCEGGESDGKVFPSLWKTCCDCNGAGYFHCPDIFALVEAVKGRKPGKLRSKRPEDARAYYVWRLARFHGGADVCLPMSAEMEIGGDPYKPLLETLSKMVARGTFGSENVGSARWQQAMYGSHSYPDLPAVIDGPTYDADKPAEEMLETV